jgi:hypothetical protein
MAGWFARFPARTESRQDDYLLDPHLPGLSVKIRGGGALDVKVYRGSPGILQLAGGARGRLESWQKWSFPTAPPGPGSGAPAGWWPVRKRRRISRFSLASEAAQARAPGPGDEPGCEVELTEVHTRGQAWWTLGFEATGGELKTSGNDVGRRVVVVCREIRGRQQPQLADVARRGGNPLAVQVDRGFRIPSVSASGNGSGLRCRAGGIAARE